MHMYIDADTGSTGEAVATQRMELTNVHLRRSQRQALRLRAEAQGTNPAQEIRAALDAYLSGAMPPDLVLLDAAARHAEREITEMCDILAAASHKADAVFAELDKLRAAPSPSADG